MTITIDKRRAGVVFKHLLAALRAKQYPYSIAALPQDIIPEKIRQNELDHALFLFYACHYMRGAIRSETAFQQLLALRDEQPWLFVPAEVARRANEPSIIAAYLRRALDYHTDQIAGFWLENSRRLSDNWQSDPRKIFEGVTSGTALRQRLVNKENAKQPGNAKPGGELFNHGWGFLGFQGKMASMLAYFLMEARLIEPFPMAPAVDFHLLRVMLATGVIVVDEATQQKGVRYDQIHPLGQQLLEAYCVKHNVSLVEIGDALWALSTTLCRMAPGNASVGRSKERLPRREKAVPQALALDAGNSQHLDRYWRSCGNCPGAKLCTLSVPSGPYYESGAFYPRSRITLPPPPEGMFGLLPLHPKKVPVFPQGKLAPEGGAMPLHTLQTFFTFD